MVAVSGARGNKARGVYLHAVCVCRGVSGARVNDSLAVY